MVFRQPSGSGFRGSTGNVNHAIRNRIRGDSQWIRSAADHGGTATLPKSASGKASGPRTDGQPHATDADATRHASRTRKLVAQHLRCLHESGVQPDPYAPTDRWNLRSAAGWIQRVLRSATPSTSQSTAAAADHESGTAAVERGWKLEQRQRALIWQVSSIASSLTTRTTQPT